MKQSVNELLATANRIQSTLKLSADELRTYSDVDILFFQRVINGLTGILPEATHYSCISVLSGELGLPLAHIHPSDLQRFDHKAVGNFLEILDFLADYQSNRRRQVPAACTDNDYRSGSREKSKHANIDQTTSTAEITVINRNGDCGTENRSQQQTPGSFVEMQRKHYLRSKLLEYLETHSISSSNSLSSDRLSPLIRPNYTSDLCRVPTRSSSVIRPRTVPLSGVPIGKRSSHSTSSIRRNVSGMMRCDESEIAPMVLDRLSSAMPGLHLEPHDRRILERKTSQLLQLQSARYFRKRRSQSQPAASHSNSNWLEDRQRRRWAQLVRQDLKFDRSQEQRSNDAIARQIKGKSAERRSQLVRARNYYRQFVQQFQAEKQSTIFKEEELFRRVYNEILAEEWKHWQNVQKLDAEEKRCMAVLKNTQLESLEHQHRSRMALLKERMDLDREALVQKMKDEQMELRGRKREIRRQMETNIRSIQQIILSTLHDTEFRQCDADRLIEQARYSVR